MRPLQDPSAFVKGEGIHCLLNPQICISNAQPLDRLLLHSLDGIGCSCLHLSKSDIVQCGFFAVNKSYVQICASLPVMPLVFVSSRSQAKGFLYLMPPPSLLHLFPVQDFGVNRQDNLDCPPPLSFSPSLSPSLSHSHKHETHSRFPFTSAIVVFSK